MAYAKYEAFTVASELHSYKLSIGSFSGTAGDALSYHSGMKFSTKDRDNDLHNVNSAVHNKAAWWYKNCFVANLNGLYLIPADESYETSFGIVWRKWHNDWRSMKKTEMKTRPSQF